MKCAPRLSAAQNSTGSHNSASRATSASGWLGPVEQEIRAEIFRGVVADGLSPADDAFDDAVGKPRHRHRQGIEGFRLRVPFRRDALRNPALRSRERLAGGRAHRLAVKRHREAIRRFRDLGLLIKPLALRRARATPDRLLRIER